MIQLDEAGNFVSDSMGDPTCMPGIQPTEIAGKTFLLTDKDGDELRFTAVPNTTADENEKVIGSTTLNEILANKELRIIHRHLNGVDCTKEEREELMTHSDTCNHIHGEQSNPADDEVYWRFRRILAHEGPLTHRDKNCKGCAYDLLVEWETGEQTMEPLSLVTADDPVTVATHAEENDMLDTNGWRRLKRIAKREKVLNRLANQAKL